MRQTSKSRQTDADRQTRALAALALILGLSIASLSLTRQLIDASEEQNHVRSEMPSDLK